MMLKEQNTKTGQSINIEYDLYTPINIEFGSWNISKVANDILANGRFQEIFN